MQIPSNRVTSGAKLAQRISDYLNPRNRLFQKSELSLAPKILFTLLKHSFRAENQHLRGDNLNTYVRALRNHLQGVISAINNCFNYGFYESAEDKTLAQTTLIETEGKLEKLEQMLQKYKDLQSQFKKRF